VGDLLRAGVRLRPVHALRHQHRPLRADVEGRQLDRRLGEAADQRASSANSQIQEFLDQYNGAGVQHIALLTPDITATIEEMRKMGQEFLDVPDTYYDGEFDERVGQIQEDKTALKKLKILVDRDNEEGYCSSFSPSASLRGPRCSSRSSSGAAARSLGEGNFRALFEAIEREQAKRGSL